MTGTLPAGNIPSLAGDVSGSITSNSVDKVHGATIPAAGALVTGNAPYVSGTSALTYSALNLAGGSGWVSGVLPAANVAAPAGDVTGTTIAANRVTTISGASVGNAVTMTSGVHLDFTGGTLDNSGTYQRWSGDGMFISPTTNLKSLLAGVSSTTGGLWFGSNTTTPTSTNATLFYNSTTDVASVQSVTNAGRAQLVVNTNEVGVEAASFSGRLVAALARGSTVTTSQVQDPTGDGVVYIANAAAWLDPKQPLNNAYYPIAGGMMYCINGALYFVGTDGQVTCISPA